MHKAICELCHGHVLSLGNMGKRALISHADGKKHKAAQIARNKSVSQHEPISTHWNIVSRSSDESQEDNQR